MSAIDGVHEAASERAGRGPGVTSNVARSLVRDLLEAPVQARLTVMRGLKPEEWAWLLREAQRETGSLYGLWYDTPSGFTEDVIGETVWGKQREVMDAIVTHKRVAVPAGFGVGKTFSAGRVTAWAGAVNPPGSMVVVTTATRERQVKRQMWPHIRTAVAKGKLPGTTDIMQWKMPTSSGNDVVVAYGFSAADNDEAAMQGIHGCYAGDVEVLTNEGWKPFPEVRGDELVMSLRPDGVAEWGEITEVTNVEIDGYLNVHDGDRVNFSVTDGHRMLWSPLHYRKPDRLRCPYCQAEVGAKGRAQHEGKHLRAGLERLDVEWEGLGGDERQWQLGSYMDLPQEFFVRRTNGWEGTPLEPITFPGARPRDPSLTFTPDQLARFLGWYVAEGHVADGMEGKTRRLTVCIAQNQGAKYETIAALLDEAGIRYTRTDHSLRFRHTALALWLQEHCGVGSGAKRVPQIIKEAPQVVIRAFLDAYRMGDGARHTHPNSARYITSSKALADDVHELLVKMGTARKMRRQHKAGSASVGPQGTPFLRKSDTWVVTEAGRPADSNVKKANVRRVRHKGPVYCVTTPHETLMVRRNGTPFWCGNTPKLLLIVDEAGGIARLIGRGTNNLLTGDAAMLAIGNPAMNDPGSWFEDLCAEGEKLEEPGTVTIRIAAIDSPAITGEPTPICRACVPNLDGHTIAGGTPSHLPDREWLLRTLREYGANVETDGDLDEIIRSGKDPKVHPYVTAKVFAQFPKDGGNKVMPASWVEAAEQVEDPTGPNFSRLCDLGLSDETEAFTVQAGSWVRLGVDVAADGGDEFAIYRMVGDVVHRVHTSSGSQNADSTVVAERILQEIDRAQRLADRLGSRAPVRVKVDKNGLGWGAVGSLERWFDTGRHQAQIVGVMVSESPEREDEAALMRPYRKRDEMWLAGRFLLQPDPSTGFGRMRLRLDREAAIQLTLPNLEFNSAGFTVVESKRSLKARQVSSPDRAEAALLAMYEPIPILAKKRRGLLTR